MSSKQELVKKLSEIESTYYTQLCLKSHLRGLRSDRLKTIKEEMKANAKLTRQWNALHEDYMKTGADHRDKLNKIDAEKIANTNVIETKTTPFNEPIRETDKVVRYIEGVKAPKLFASRGHTVIPIPVSEDLKKEVSSLGK